jgi:hypothetical protein
MIHAEQRLKIRHTALLAAIDVLLEGPEAINRTLDPSADGPFAWQPLPDGGFALISAWPDDETGKGGEGGDSYVSLTIGRQPD